MDHGQQKKNQEPWKTNGSIINVPRTPWPGTQELPGDRTHCKTSLPEGPIAQMLT